MDNGQRVMAIAHPELLLRWAKKKKKEEENITSDLTSASFILAISASKKASSAKILAWKSSVIFDLKTNKQLKSTICHYSNQNIWSTN